MENKLLEIQVDSDLTEKATEIYSKLGIDITTAIKIFLTRSVEMQGLPFEMKLQNNDDEKVLQAIKRMSYTAEKNNVSNMTLEEINSEIEASRLGRVK